MQKIERARMKLRVLEQCHQPMLQEDLGQAESAMKRLQYMIDQEEIVHSHKSRDVEELEEEVAEEKEHLYMVESEVTEMWHHINDLEEELYSV